MQRGAKGSNSFTQFFDPPSPLGQLAHWEQRVVTMNRIHRGPLINCNDVIVGETGDGSCFRCPSHPLSSGHSLHAHASQDVQLTQTAAGDRGTGVLHYFKFVVSRQSESVRVVCVCGRHLSVCQSQLNASYNSLSVGEGILALECSLL